jgi:hypothetical protein
MLKLRFKRSYRSQNSGKTVFVYTVTGKQADVELYKESCGDYLRHEDDDESKAPLFFVTQFAGEQGTLLPNAEGTRFYVDKSEDDKINSLIEQHAGTALGTALATAKAAELMAAMRKQAPATSVVTKQQEEKAPENLDGL